MNNSKKTILLVFFSTIICLPIILISGPIANTLTDQPLAQFIIVGAITWIIWPIITIIEKEINKRK